MRNKKQICRMTMMSVLCLLASFALLASAADAKTKTKTKGTVCKGVQWSYSSSSQTLTISGKGYAKINGFQKYGSYTWPATEEGALPAFKKIVFKEGITKIDFAYFTMEGINSIALPKSLKTIAHKNSYKVNGKYEPYSTTLKKITVNKKNKTFSSSNGVLYSKDKKTLYVYPAGKIAKMYSISKKVTKIARDAFYGSDIQTVKLPVNLTSIGINAFRYSTITTLQTNKKLKKIGDSAFFKTDLANIVLPESMTTIGKWAFESCSLTRVVLPQKITKIGSYAFYGNQNLKSIVIYCNCDLQNVFYNCSTTYEGENHEIAVTLGKNVKTTVTDLITDLGTKITFTVQAGNTKYYMKDGSLYAVRGNKLLYTPQKSEPNKTEQPASTPTPGESGISPAA